MHNMDESYNVEEKKLDIKEYKRTSIFTENSKTGRGDLQS